MKRVNFFLALALLMAVTACTTPAQLAIREDRQVRRETEDQQKDQVKEIKGKAVKEARLEAKRLEKKENWTVLPGAMPMDKQLEKVWMKQYAENPDGTPTYIFADGNGVGKTMTAAEMQAMEAAKLQLAGQISNEVNQIIEGKIANDQIDRETGNSLTKFVAGSKNYIIQNLSYVRPGFKVYREVGQQDLEVQVKLFYNAEEAMIAAQKALEQKIRNELEDEADELIEEIDTLFR